MGQWVLGPGLHVGRPPARPVWVWGSLVGACTSCVTWESHIAPSECWVLVSQAGITSELSPLKGCGAAKTLGSRTSNTAGDLKHYGSVTGSSGRVSPNASGEWLGAPLNILPLSTCSGPALCLPLCWVLGPSDPSLSLIHGLLLSAHVCQASGSNYLWGGEVSDQN